MKTVLFSVMLLMVALTVLAAGCQKEESKSGQKPGTEQKAGDGHDHSSHSKDDGHGH